MIRILKKEDIKIGAHIIRNDVVSSTWLEDKIHYQEKVDWFLNNWNNLDKSKFQVVL